MKPSTALSALSSMFLLFASLATQHAFAAQVCSVNDTQRFTNILSADKRFRVNANLFNVPNGKLCVDYDYERTKTAFTVRNNGVSIPLGGAPMGYPNVYKGCHYGACTNGFAKGRLVRDIAGSRSTWKIAGTGAGGIWNAAYDIWFNQQQDAPDNANPNGLELMIWVNHKGGATPAGDRKRNRKVDGRNTQVWIGNVEAQSSKVITYVLVDKTNSVENINLKAFYDDAKRRGLLKDSWYLTSIQAGFEVWEGGDGLRSDYFAAGTSR